MIRDNAVDLLRAFQGVEPVAGLHMNHRDMELHRRQCRCHGGVGIAVYQQSVRLFLQQDLEYQKTVLPDQVLRVSIEAGSTYGWHRFVGSEGLAIGLDHFGASAPANILAEKFGFTPEGIIQQIQAHFIPAEPHSCSGSCGSCTGCH